MRHAKTTVQRGVKKTHESSLSFTLHHIARGNLRFHFRNFKSLSVETEDEEYRQDPMSWLHVG